MKKRTKISIAISTVVIISIIAFGINYLLRYNNYEKAIDDIAYSNIDISTIPDGTYTGDCDVDFIYAKVEVTVSDGVIQKITLIEHQNDRGKAAEGIENEIVKQQKVDVDAVSGATNSSKVIKKAVDNALSSAGKKVQVSKNYKNIIKGMVHEIS